MDRHWIFPLSAALVGSVHAAAAHAFLQSATPAVGSAVAKAPAEVVIDFTEGVEPLFSTITMQEASGHRVDSGHVHLAGDNRHLAIALARLPPGRYRVYWHVVSVDSHKTQGDFVFSVAP